MQFKGDCSKKYPVIMGLTRCISNKQCSNRVRRSHPVRTLFIRNTPSQSHNHPVFFRTVPGSWIDLRHLRTSDYRRFWACVGIMGRKRPSTEKGPGMDATSSAPSTRDVNLDLLEDYRTAINGLLDRHAHTIIIPIPTHHC